MSEDIVAKFNLENEPIKATFKAYEQSASDGTTDYELLDNKPSINDVTLIGNKTLDELGIQPIGNYALKTEIPTQISELTNNKGYTTQSEVMALIASIPQFKLSIVEELPEVGEKMTLYLIAKDGTDKDVYNEYIWLETTSTFEFIGTTAVDLTNYYTKTEVDDKLELAVPKTSTTITTGETVQTKTLYYVGEKSILLFGLPSEAKIGDYVFVNFKSGSTPTNFTIMTSNYVGDIPSPIPNKTYELLATYNGENWVCQWIAY